MANNKEITLAEFLGWEEGKEYRCPSGKYLITDDTLYRYENNDGGWQPVRTCFIKSFINSMREAEPIEEKKYHLINPEIADESDRYLNTIILGDRVGCIFFSDKSSDFTFKAVFTIAEIEMIKARYPKTFSICEVVGVKNGI